jgi:hypothetical protein
MPKLCLTFPREGDVLNRHDGRMENGALVVPVSGRAPGGPVTVNGLPAAVGDDGSFTCEAPLRLPESVIRVRAGGETLTARVLVDLHSRPRYRFSVDDNIEWLADLGAEPDRYASLFDHWYLAFWKRMHGDFGAKIHMNIYYQTVDGRFNLSMLPTKWRDEFERNSPWLHLSFHARQDQPPLPYQHAGYDELARDFEQVMGEIYRFAGEAVTSRETTVHWAAAPREACRALVERGVDILIGIFFVEREEIETKYYLDDALARHIRGRDAWKDFSEGLLFVDCDWVVNNLQLEEIPARLEERAANPHTGEMMELLIHEQYFREENGFFQPDAQQKVETALRWVAGHGYRPCFWGSDE